MGGGEIAKELLEPSRLANHQQAADSGHNAPMCMRHTTRQEDHVAGPDIELGIATLDDVLALQDIEELVLLGVNVQGCIRHRGNLLEDREGATRSLRGRLQDKPDLTEDDGLGEGLLGSARVHAAYGIAIPFRRGHRFGHQSERRCGQDGARETA